MGRSSEVTANTRTCGGAKSDFTGHWLGFYKYAYSHFALKLRFSEVDYLIILDQQWNRAWLKVCGAAGHVRKALWLSRPQGDYA